MLLTIIWALDLATQTGSCYGRPDTIPETETVRAPVTGDDYGAFGGFYWHFFNRRLDDLVWRLKEDERLIAVYETPILPREKWDPVQRRMVGQTNIETTRKLHSLGVLFETCCTVHQAAERIDLFECSIGTIKKELGGGGRAEKADLVAAARRAGITLPEGKEAFDAADAFGAWLLGIRYHAKEHLSAWDKRVRGGINNFRG